MSILKRLLFPHTYSSDAYIAFLRKKSIKIGKNCKIYSPNRVIIDTQRPHMLEIGNNVIITDGVKILCHDYSRSVLCNYPGLGNVGESGFTKIGNNVFIGMNSIILMGSEIGDNSIIAAGTVVTGVFGSNVVIGGNPARVICSISDFYKKRKDAELQAAKKYVECWFLKYGKYPTIYEMTNAFSWLYLPHTDETIEKYPSLFDLSGVDNKIYYDNFYNKKPIFNSFDEFIDFCKIHE